MAKNSTKHKNTTNNIYSYNTSADYNPLVAENKILKETVDHMKQELERYRSPALLVAEVISIVKKDDDKRAVVRLPNGNRFLVNIDMNIKKLNAGDTVILEQKNLTVTDKISASQQFDAEKFVIIKKPAVTWNDIGGLEEQVNEIKEIIELPLNKPDLFKKVGITPPKGILLYGEPGTGKTLLAKAVANSTNSTFIEIVASELVQKFIGEGAKLVKEIFEMARKKAPSIVFIDELDALASRRIDVGTSGEREVQRTFMQLLAEIDGFNALDNVKIIGCTNRKDILDEAITRPGRLDRLIFVPNPDKEGIKEIFKIHTRNMKFAKGFKVDDIIKNMENFSGAEINACVTEAGYFAIRDNRSVVNKKDILKAIDKIKRKEEMEGKGYINMFG